MPESAPEPTDIDRHAPRALADSCRIVAIGASAGGLDAFTQLLEALPAHLGLALVLTQHLHPAHESHLSEILSRHSKMPVTEVVNGVHVECDHIYVIPANAAMTVSAGFLHLESLDATGSAGLPIDLFFDSLVRDGGEGSVGVILSGTGTDGTIGLAAIKRAGGLAFVQDPETAEYDGMPRSALDTGVVDAALSPEDLAQLLIRVGANEYVKPSQSVESEDEASLTGIIDLMRASTGLDLSEYRRSTLTRRISRRMLLCSVGTMSDYLALLGRDAAEVQALYRDVLVNVTEFFRDSEVLEAIKDKAFPEISRSLLPDGSLRVWVPGCSKGQEAYSIAILIAEYFEQPLLGRAQVFASDINAADIEVARAGVYPRSIEAEVPPERLARFFTPDRGGYRVDQVIRDMCVFAVHDVVQDPPFSKVDLVSFRNVLIYMERPLQERVLQVLHYALNPGGFLILGTAEAAATDSTLFKLVDKKSRIYESLAIPRVLPVIGSRRSGRKEASGAPEEAPEDVSTSELEDLRTVNEEFQTAQEELQSTNEELTTLNDELRARNVELVALTDDLTNVLEGAEIALLILDSELRIRRFTPQSEAIVNILPVDVGRPITDLRLKIAALDLVGAAQEVLRERRPSQTEVQDDAGRWYSMRIRPFHTRAGKFDGLVLAFFDVDGLKQLSQAASLSAERASVLRELAEIGITGKNVNELAQRQAQTVIRVLGASNAAIVLSDGERLQPVALIGYPDDYIDKLTPMPEDTLTAQVFRSGEARYVTDANASDASEFTRTVSSALGFGSLAAVPLGPSEAPFGAVGFVWHETLLFDADEVTFLESVASEIAVGLSNQRAEDMLRENEEQFRSLAESIPNLAWWAKADGYITWYNRRWYEYTGTTPEQMEGWGWQSVHDPEVLPSVLERWGASIAMAEPFDMEFPLRGADGVFRTFLTRVEPMKDSSGNVVRWFATNTDISSIKATEDRLRALVDAEKESARLSEALNGVNRAVHSTLEIDEVMQHALDAGVRVLDCDSGAVEMLVGGEWVVRYQTGFSPQDVGMRLSEAEAPNATRAALQGVPFHIDDMSGDERTNVGFVKRYGLKSVLAVPLFAKGAVTGCALFYASKDVRHFTEAEIDFGRKLGSVVSLGLENARLYSTERNTAQTLQRALLTLPESLRDIDFAPWYRAATESTLVGGDFYAIFELDDDRIGITIGDISGKGLGAAVLTSLVKDTIRAHANERTKTSAQVLTLTNDLVYRSTPTESFATVFFGILDRRDGRLSFANAGHTTAAIMKCDGTVSSLAGTDPILGAFASVDFGETEARLAVGEVLFLYTDGLTEARRGAELYGEKRLFDLLATLKLESAQGVVADVMDDVMHFASGHLRDDLAILALRRLEPGAQASEAEASVSRASLWASAAAGKGRKKK